MPLNEKGQKIMRSMKKTYGKHAKEVFYASKNKGKIKGVEYSNKHAGSHCLTSSQGVVVSGYSQAAK